MKRILDAGMDERRYAVLASCIAGAAVFLLEYGFCLLYTTSFSVMGVEAKSITDIVFSRFKGLIAMTQLKILLAYMCAGAIYGGCLGYAIGILQLGLGRVRSVRKTLPAVAVCTLLFSLSVLQYDMLLHPALYNEHFYARGGVAAAIQVFITDTLPAPAAWTLRALFLAALVPAAAGLSLACGRFLFGKWRSSPTWLRTAFAASAAAILMSVFLAGRGNSGPNVIILAADSFRHDRVSAWGRRKGLTPNLDALAREGFVFHDAHVQLPRTFPSWYGLLYGTYPALHGVRHMFPHTEVLGRSMRGLPEALAEKGYETSAVADYAGDIFTRMRCFNRVKAPFFDFTVMIRQRSLEIHFLLLPLLQNAIGRAVFPEMKEFAQNSDPAFLLADIESEIFRLAGKKKFFLSVFASATHFPYATPRPWYGKYTSPGYRGVYKYLKINDPMKTSTVSDADRDQIRGLFDGACGAVDELAGGVIASLKRHGLYENSIIIFTADHGENLYDDGLDLGHGEHFRGEYATHVPLIIKFNRGSRLRRTAGSYDGLIQQIDIAPTLLDVLGMRGLGTPGVSYRRVIEDPASRVPRIAFAETGIWFVEKGDQFFQRQRISYPDVSVLCTLEEPGYGVVLKREYEDLISIAKHRAVFDERWKLVYIPTRGGVQYELYRRGDREYVNRYAPGNPEFLRLYRHLERYMTDNEKMKSVNGMFLR